MRKIYLALFLFTFGTGILVAEEGTCQRCQRIREYNKNHPENNYYWYDDYLKEKGNQPKEKESSSDQKNKDAPTQNQ